MIAAAHFLALLSPGPDFFLITRTSLYAGWRVASGTCLGIALANGVFIIAAFAGFSALRPGGLPFVTLQLFGCLYLLYLGWLFICHAGDRTLQVTPGAAPGQSTVAAHTASWLCAMGMGFLSGILNPKNALFYASLAAMLTGAHASVGSKIAYGTWMFGIVLLWDLLVAVAIGNQTVLQRFSRILPRLERISGAILILLGLGVIAALVIN